MTEKSPIKWAGKKPTEEQIKQILADHLGWLGSGSKGDPPHDLSGADLSGANFEKADLYRADLHGADLCKAVLREANLVHANLKGADLYEANLEGANLRETNLEGADLWHANLGHANLCWADLREAKLQHAFLCWADLYEANLREANFREAFLQDTNLKNANLEGADFWDADLKWADLSNARLERAILIGTDLRMSSLIFANLTNAEISGACLDDANKTQWIIAGIKCTYIVRNGKSIDYAEGDFEKTDISLERVQEIILNTPFSTMTDITGRIIQEAINKKLGQPAVFFKGQNALSGGETKLEFIIPEDREPGDKSEAILKDMQEKLNYILAQKKGRHETKSIIGVKKEIDVSELFGDLVRPYELGRLLTEHLNQLSPLLQRIIQAVQSAI